MATRRLFTALFYLKASVTFPRGIAMVSLSTLFVVLSARFMMAALATLFDNASSVVLPCTRERACPWGARYGRKPSKTIWSACSCASARCASVRTVQVITGICPSRRQR